MRLLTSLFFTRPTSRLAVFRLASSRSALAPTRTMHVQSIPMWQGKGNNYAYVVTDEQTREALVIDPANPSEVLPVLDQRTSSGDMKLVKILNTHHHHDHAGGNAEILRTYPLPIWGGADCAHATHTPAHNAAFSLGAHTRVVALHTPCHTQDSICWLVENTENADDKAVFTGDTLFVGGCGRFFEGNALEMHEALNSTLASLDERARVFPGHEYTKGNVRFAKSVLPSDDAALARLDAFAQVNTQTQGHFTIADEKRHNLFMRVNMAVSCKDAVETMAALREMKNRS